MFLYVNDNYMSNNTRTFLFKIKLRAMQISSNTTAKKFKLRTKQSLNTGFTLNKTRGVYTPYYPLNDFQKKYKKMLIKKIKNTNF